MLPDPSVADLKNIVDAKYAGKIAMADPRAGSPLTASGSMLKGVRRFGNGAETHSIVMRSKTGTVRWISAHHNFSIKTGLPSWA